MLNHRAYPPFFLYSGPLIHIPIVLLKSLCKQPGWFLNLWVMKRSWLWSGSVLRIWIPSPSGPTNYPCSDSYIHPHKCMARFLRISLLLNYDNSPPMCWDKSLLCFIPLCCTFCHLPGSWPEITSLSWECLPAWISSLTSIWALGLVPWYVKPQPLSCLHCYLLQISCHAPSGIQRHNKSHISNPLLCHRIDLSLISSVKDTFIF